MKRLKKNNQGFTLIELVVVIAILGILAGIAIPRLDESRKRAAITAHNANVKTIESAATMYIADGGENLGSENAPVVVTEENVGKYLQEIPEVPKVVNEDSTYKIIIKDGEITVIPGSE
ncbi:MAG: prepilin-type N-terminal cleavage/methylation domain-containing protein [Tissierellia bacterium]|nr:prepilin-type N-terminal cleavage/methylation domain-containing protein [Tissierellia bacterium]